MQRLYCPSPDISGNRISICDKQEVHHFKDVKRIREKEEVVVFDGKGKEYFGFIEEISPRALIVKIREIKSSPLAAPLFQATLAVAIPKRSRMEYIIEKCTELGVDTLIPMRTDRTVVTLKKDKEAQRISRWQKLAIEASKQSGRAIVPKIRPVAEFKEVLAQVKDYDLAILFCLSAEKRESLREILLRFKGGSILALVGPEGDFSLEEIHLAREAGCILASLGERVLKVDTAAIFVMAGLNLHPGKNLTEKNLLEI